MASTSQGSAVPAGYMDGVSVKIAEKYKPPKRITVSMSYSQMVTLNKLVQEPTAGYDFALEESVKSRMREWHRARCVAGDERRQRLKYEVDTKHEVSESTETIGEVPDNTSISNTYVPGLAVLMPITASQTILTPTPHTANLPAYALTKRSFNFSEFESDTSSPFDNMELKTINDLEELAQVLNHDSEGCKPAKPVNGYYDHTYEYGLDTVRSVPEIMRSLEKELASAQPTSKQVPSVPDAFSNLSTDMQQMAVKISSMGFPLDRVARACQALDGNQKKVVEHLLALSALLDLGFPEQNVVSALLKCNNDRDKALDLLIT